MFELLRLGNRQGALLALVAAAGMLLTGVPGRVAPAAASAILVPICGDPGHSVAIPLGEGGGQRPDCPKGCHAMCTRRDILEDDD